MFAGEKIYNDASVEDIETLPLTQIHRNVDTTIVAADQTGAYYVARPMMSYDKKTDTSTVIQDMLNRT